MELKKDYYFNYEINNTKKELQEFLVSYKNELEMLKTVKREKKKDWNDFQNFLKNFSCWKNTSLTYDSDNYKLVGYINWNYERVYLNSYSIDKDFIEKVRENEPERIVKMAYEVEKVFYTPQEFFEIEIKNKIDRTEKQISKTEKAISEFDETQKEIEKNLIPLLEFIQSQDDSVRRYVRKIIETTISHYY